MMISIDEANPRGDDGPEDVKAAGHPSYDDLLEENKYLRSEISRFYEEVVIPPRVGHECYHDIDIQHSEHEYEYGTVCSEQKTSFRNLESDFKALQADFNHLQAHSNEQALESRRASRTIEELQYELNVANAELLQILPLRLKLTESNKKIENLRKDNVATGENLSNLLHEKHILASRLDQSRTSLENMQNELRNGIVKSARFDEEIRGLNLEVERLQASIIEKSLAAHTHEDCIKKLNEKILILRGDCAHWERKSISGSKELLRLNNLEQVYAMQENTDLMNKNSALKIKLKSREEAIKDILRQSSSQRKILGTRFLKRSKCANLKSCITEQRKSPRSAISINKSCNYSITSAAPTESAKIYVCRSNDAIATEISTCKMKDMGIEMTCDSIDDQDNGVEMCDKDDIVDQTCLCGGFSFFNRRFL